MTCEPKPLLELSARCGFFDLSVSWLKQLADLRDIDYENSSLGGLLEALCRYFIPDLTDAQLLDILEMRLASYEATDVAEDLISCEWVCDSLDKATSDEILTAIKDCRATHTMRADFATEVNQLKVRGCRCPSCFVLPCTPGGTERL